MKTIAFILLQTSNVKSEINTIFSDIVIPVTGLLILVTAIGGLVAALIKGSGENNSMKDAFMDVGKIVALVVVILIAIGAIAGFIATKLTSVRVL